MIREEIWMQSYMITSLYSIVLSTKTVFNLSDCTSKRMLTMMIIIDDDDCIEFFVDDDDSFDDDDDDV